MTTLRKLVQCPRCRFRNPATAVACLACKVALPQSSDGGATPSSAFSRTPTPTASRLPETAHGSSHGDLRPSEQPTRRLPREQAPSVAARREPTPSALNAAQILAKLQAMARSQGQAAAAAPSPPPSPAPPASPPATQRFAAGGLSADTRRYEHDAPPSAPGLPEPVRPPVSQVPSFRVDDPRIVAWLHCEPFSPVPIGITPVLSLGRAPDSDLVLPHPGVSRTHGVVRVAGQDVVFEDRSTYGSYVNGERVLTRRLQVGDTLLVGPYEIKVRSTQEVRDRVHSEGEETCPLQSFTNLPSTDAMSGRLEKSSLSEVLQTIEFNQKSGTLEVFTDAAHGHLVVYEGVPMFAEFGDLDDDEAVFAMIAQRRGYFTFRSKIEAGEKTMETTITGLLLEANRRLDEQGAPTA